MRQYVRIQRAIVPCVIPELCYADGFTKLFREEGVRAAYRGLTPTVLALLPSWAIYFPVYEHMKGKLRGTLPLFLCVYMHTWHSFDVQEQLILASARLGMCCFVLDQCLCVQYHLQYLGCFVPHITAVTCSRKVMLYACSVLWYIGQPKPACHFERPCTCTFVWFHLLLVLFRSIYRPMCIELASVQQRLLIHHACMHH